MAWLSKHSTPPNTCGTLAVLNGHPSPTFSTRCELCAAQLWPAPTPCETHIAWGPRQHSTPLPPPLNFCRCLAQVIGHVPMLADPTFAELVHRIGIASLGADEKQLWHLTKIYW